VTPKEKIMPSAFDGHVYPGGHRIFIEPENLQLRIWQHAQL
jgi:hypothetical protein